MVLAAVLENCYAVRYASEELKNDPDIKFLNHDYNDLILSAIKHPFLFSAGVGLIAVAAVIVSGASITTASVVSVCSSCATFFYIPNVSANILYPIEKNKAEVEFSIK